MSRLMVLAILVIYQRTNCGGVTKFEFIQPFLCVATANYYKNSTTRLSFLSLCNCQHFPLTCDMNKGNRPWSFRTFCQELDASSTGLECTCTNILLTCRIFNDNGDYSLNEFFPITSGSGFGN